MSKIYRFALAAVLTTPCSALASQSPVQGGPIGATDINNALLPKEAGVYLGLSEVVLFPDRLTDNNYNLKPGAASATISALYLLYKYPFKLFSGDVASGLQEGYDTTARFTTPSLGKAYQTSVGWRDLYVDFINWSKYVGPLFGEAEPAQPSGSFVPYGLTFKAEYSMILPIGRYYVKSVLNPGTGTTFFIPNFSATYLTPPDVFGPMELDYHLFYDARAENPYNDYSNGAVIDMDFAVAQRFKGFTVGMVGAYAVQVQNDTEGAAGHRFLAPPNGDHFAILQLGPIVSIPIPALHATFKLKAPIGIFARNTLLINQVVGNIVFPIP